MTVSSESLSTFMNTPVTPPPSRSKSRAEATPNAEEDLTPRPASKTTTTTTPTTPQTYPRGTPVTPPSPVLSVSQLKIPPSRSNGTIPIMFDSDSGSDSPTDDDDDIPSFRRKRKEESPSSAARRRIEITHALKKKRHASDVSDAPTTGRRSINSFGIPRQFEKMDTEELADRETRRISVQTSSSSFTHPRPSSALSFASTITIDSPFPAVQPLPQVSLSSLTRQQNHSGSFDALRAAEKTNDNAIRTSFVLTYSHSQSFTSLSRLSHGVETPPKEHQPATLGSDSEPPSREEPATSVEIAFRALDKQSPSTPEPASHNSPPEKFIVVREVTNSPQHVQSPIPPPSSLIQPHAPAPLPRTRNGTNIPAITIPTVQSSPSYSASHFAQRVSEQYQRELEKEKLDGRLNPSTLRTRSSSAGRLGVRFRSRSPSVSAAISPPIRPSTAVSSFASSKHSGCAVADHGPSLRELSSFPRVQSPAMGKRRPWTSAGTTTAKTSGFASFSLRGRTADGTTGASLSAHQKRPMSAQTREQPRPSTSTSASLSVTQESTLLEICQNPFFHSITPSSTRSERSPSEDRANSVMDAVTLGSTDPRSHPLGSRPSTSASAITSQAFKDKDDDYAYNALPPYSPANASGHNRGRHGISGAHGRPPWPYATLGSDDGSFRSPSRSRPSTSYVQDQMGDDGSSSRFARLETSGLSHLGSTVVHLLIDQEHFREVLPRFHFNRLTRCPSSPKRPPRISRYSVSTMASGGSTVPLNARSESSDSSGPLAPGDSVLEFKPTQRQSYAFHYAALDTSPTLRRLHLNDDMKRDYLSREGSLVLKSNGVYSIRGTEDKGRVLWQFMYLVDDRRNAAGEKMSGEKMVTPLSFTCSPELLTPERGKKIGLLQVAKKALLPKLGATKLDPPALPRVPPPPAKEGYTSESMSQLLDISNTIDRRSVQVPRETMRPVPHKPSVNALSRISSAPVKQPQSTTSNSERTAPLGRVESLQPTASKTIPSNFNRPQTSEPPNSRPLGDSMTATTQNSPPFTQAFRVALSGPKQDPPEKALSAISMWDAKANPASRPPKAVLLRPVTSRERTSEQAVAVDTILSPPQRKNSMRRRVRPATADALLSSRPWASSHSNPRPPLQVLVPTSIPPSSSPTAPASAATTTRSPFITPPLVSSGPSSSGGERLGGPIASPDQIRAWLSEAQPETPTLSPISQAHGPLPTIVSEYNFINLSSPTDLILPPSIPSAKPPLISPGGIREFARSPRLPTKDVSRPSTAHEIRRTPPPIF